MIDRDIQLLCRPLNTQRIRKRTLVGTNRKVEASLGGPPGERKGLPAKITQVRKLISNDFYENRVVKGLNTCVFIDTYLDHFTGLCAYRCLRKDKGRSC